MITKITTDTLFKNDMFLATELLMFLGGFNLFSSYKYTLRRQKEGQCVYL